MFIEYVQTVLILWLLFAVGTGMVVDHYVQAARGQGAEDSVSRPGEVAQDTVTGSRTVSYVGHDGSGAP